MRLLLNRKNDMQGIKNLTHGPINRQLFNLAMPIMATSFIQMAYSLTDMAWVGRFGRNPDVDVRFYLLIK